MGAGNPQASEQMGGLLGKMQGMGGSMAPQPAPSQTAIDPMEGMAQSQQQPEEDALAPPTTSRTGGMNPPQPSNNLAPTGFGSSGMGMGQPPVDPNMQQKKPGAGGK